MGTERHEVNSRFFTFANAPKMFMVCQKLKLFCTNMTDFYVMPSSTILFQNVRLSERSVGPCKN